MIINVSPVLHRGTVSVVLSVSALSSFRLSICNRAFINCIYPNFYNISCVTHQFCRTENYIYWAWIWMREVTVVWDVPPYSLVERHKRFGGNFFILKQTRCNNFTNLFWHETLHVSDSLSVHHQELFTVHSAMVYVMQFSSGTRMELQFHPDPARKLSTNLYDIHHCWGYRE